MAMDVTVTDGGDERDELINVLFQIYVLMK